MKNIHSEFNSPELISQERKILLTNWSKMIIQELRESNELNVMFICTHNSRRSQVAQVLSEIISNELNLKNIHFYSGGTEATSFNYRMVNALLNHGIGLIQKTFSVNPVYRLVHQELQLPGLFFSKKYDHQLNPQKDFMAIMVCDHADENCPLVHGAKHRIQLHYKDPKEFDGSENEQRAYKEKLMEIGRELFFVLNTLNM